MQDDTAVDWVELQVWTCVPCRRLLGLPHTVLGQAELNLDNLGSLHISNIGSSGQDGVAIDLGQSGGLSTLAPVGFPPAAPDGAYMLSTTVHNDAQLTTSMRIQRTGSVVRTILDFTNLGATTRQVRAFKDGHLVASVVHSGAWDLELTSGATAGTVCNICTGGDQRDNTAVYYTIKKPAVAATLANGQVVTADTFEFRPVDPQVTVIYTSEAGLTASGMSEMVISREEIAQLGVFHGPLGGANLEAPFGALSVANIGSSGQDGVSIDLGRVNSFDIGLDPILDGNGDPLQNAGAYLDATAVGSLGNVPDQPLGTLRVTQLALGNYQITADFTDIGSPTQHFQVGS